MKKKILMTIGIAVPLRVWIALLVATLLTQSAVLDAVLHIYNRLLWIPIGLYVLYRVYRKELTPSSIKKVLAICGISLIVDMIIVESVRYIMSGGISSILFLPACLPICLMTILYYVFKEHGDNKRDKIIVFAIGIPLLLAALYFEVLAFIDM